MQQLVPALPFFFVPKETVTERIQKFLDEKHNLLTSALNKEDTKSVWYSLEHIQILLDEMKFLNANGVRLYFGAYEQKHETAPGQLCLLMVPTRYNSGTQKIEDTIAEEEPGFSERAAQPKSASGWTINGLPIEQAQKMNYNFGAPCPPVCNYIMEYKFPH